MDMVELERVIRERIKKSRETVKSAEEEKDFVVQAIYGGRIIAYEDVLMMMDVI